MIQPMDTQARARLAAERFELLRADARSSPVPAGGVRVRAGRLLVAAGMRLAADARRSRLRPADPRRRSPQG